MSSTNSPENQRSSDQGQATIELALTLPIVMVSFLLLLQILVVILDHAQIVNAARNGIRAAAVSTDPESAAENAAQKSFGSNLDVVTQVDTTWVTVTVSHILTTDLPIVGRFVPDLEIASRFSMLLEPPLG